MSHEIPIMFGGQRMILCAGGALYWPEIKTLIVSDLHFEKSTFLASFGSFIPPFDTLDTLSRLEKLLAHYQPTRLILLGDSFHDSQAWQRLDDKTRKKTLGLGEGRECIWIEGNHDAALKEHALGRFTDAVEIQGIRLSHNYHVCEMPLIVGHYHPKVHVQLSNRSASGKCFIHSDSLLVMPAFGSYTGGLNIMHDTLRNLFPSSSHTYLIYRDNIYPLQSKN